MSSQDEDFKEFEDDFQTRFKIADENFPKVEDSGSDSDDSVVINKHPFSVRRSDYDSATAMHYSTLNPNDDSDDDSDKDDNSDEHIETEDNSNAIGAETEITRSRVSGLGFQRNTAPYIDLEDQIEVEEVISHQYKNESEDEEDEIKELYSDEELASKDKVQEDLMSPMGSKILEEESHKEQ